MDNSLSLYFSHLLENGEGYDVKIIVGEEPNIKEFKAHSIILSSRSIYFRNALSPRWANKEDGVIIYNKPNISPLVFEILIKYIYTGIFSVESDEINLMDIIVAADELQLLEVYQKLEYRLLENKLAWKSKDIITALQYDYFTSLYNYALGIMFRNPKIIFESEDFPKIKETQLIQLLKIDDLELKEIEIWEYLIKWGIQNTDSILDEDLTKWKPENFIDLKNTICNCIPHIRFYNMSPNEYTKATCHFKEILPDGFDKEVLQYFLDPNTKVSFNVLPLRGYLFDSKIINAKDAALIASWIKKRQTPYHHNNLPFEFKLIYRASRDGFGINNFHNNCDNMGPTVVVIKVHNTGEIIGGYNPLEWRSINIKENEELPLLGNFQFYNNYKCKTSNSFIFSLTNQKIPSLSRVSSKKEAIIWCRNKGPCFGLQDLCIKPLGPSNNINVICENNSYESKIINGEIFEIEEYEVFQIDKGYNNKIFQSTMKRFMKIFSFLMKIFLFIVTKMFLLIVYVIKIIIHLISFFILAALFVFFYILFILISGIPVLLLALLFYASGINFTFPFILAGGIFAIFLWIMLIFASLSVVFEDDLVCTEIGMFFRYVTIEFFGDNTFYTTFWIGNH